MKAELEKFFEEEKIGHYAALPYTALRVTNPAIMEREDFTARTVILFLLPYYAGETGNLSRYAASLDYHLLIRELTAKLCARLESLFPGARSKGYGDHSPLDECDAALRAGLGVLGDNGLILNPEYGSYVFIADVITDVPPEAIGAGEPSGKRFCEHCGACRRACPTGILRGEGSDCLSAITQRKGELDEEEKALMRRFHTAWGCDLCQTCCPHNKNPKPTPLAFFYRERVENLDRAFLDSLDKAAFSRRAFAWRGRRTVERNLDILEEKEG